MKRLGAVLLLLFSAALVIGQQTTSAATPDKDMQGRNGQASSPRPVRIRVNQDVVQPIPKTKVPPIYPKEALMKHIEGTVVLKAILSTRGEVIEVTVISGDPLLAQSAIKAVRLWKYKPFKLKGQPVEVEAQITLNFQLSNDL